MLDHDTDSYYKISARLRRRQPTGSLTRDNILDNITLYWLTGTGASAARAYWEAGRAQASAAASGQAPPEVSVPAGFTTFPGEVFAAPRSWAEAVYPTSPTSTRSTGRPLRRLGGAGALLRRGAGRDSAHCAEDRLGGTTEWLDSEPLGPPGALASRR